MRQAQAYASSCLQSGHFMENKLEFSMLSFSSSHLEWWLEDCLRKPLEDLAGHGFERQDQLGSLKDEESR